MRTRVASTLRMLVRIFRISKLPADTSAMAPKLSPVPVICRSAVRARAPDGVRLTALGAPWMSTRTHILREYRAAEEWVEAARANRIGLVRVACWRSPHAVGGRPSSASRRHSGLRSQYSRSSRWVPGRAGRYLRHCSTASPLRPHRGQILQAARERRAAHVGLLRRSVRAGGPGC